MDQLLYLAARLVITVLQWLPLKLAVRMGRGGGLIFFLVDSRHRRVALRNLMASFPEIPRPELRRIARENFKRIGESFVAAVKTAVMPPEQIARVLTVVGAEKVASHRDAKSFIFAIGHFGNFELFAHCSQFAPQFKFATTYRGLRQPGVNKLLQDLRQKSGCLFFERRNDGDALKQAMAQGGLLLGLLADQHAGDRGLRLPFLGRDCSTSPAPAVLSRRYGAPIFTAICYRTALARWRIEVGDEIPVTEDGIGRSTAQIMLDVNRAFETGIRRDPANWFWVHNRWKGKWRTQSPETTPDEIPR